METLSFEQMENVQGGKASTACTAAYARTLVFGRGGLIVADGSGLTVGFVIARKLLGMGSGSTADTCSADTAIYRN